MGSSDNHGARMLLPFSSHKQYVQRITDELAGGIGAGESRPTALLVGLSGGKVWRAEVARDGDGAFLGRGWPEFAAAHGLAGAGWFLVLRHHGGGVLTVKAFDASRCLWEFGAPAAVEATRISKVTSHKPQFISLLQPDNFKEKMPIPANFVQRYIPKEHLNSQIAVIVSPLGKFWRIALEVNQSGMSFAGGWSEFLLFHGIIEGNVLLLKYQNNMVFTVKVFGLDGCQIQSKHKDTRIQQTPTLPDIEKQRESPSASAKKRKSKNERSSSEGLKRPKGSMTYLDKKSIYEIGPQSWIKKEINKNTLENHLSLAAAYCNAIGLQEPCMITLKNSMNSTRSWQVRCNPYKHSSHQIGSGWKRFCKDNRLKQGDVCTFNVIETTLWHVDIMRDVQNQRESHCSSSMKSDRKNNSSSCEGQKWTKGSMNSLNKASLRPRCVYKIGPPSWIKKEINTSTLDNSLSLAPAFCDAIGFRKPCTITLKSSTNSTKSWQVCGFPYNNSSHKLGSGWKRFCKDNKLKKGDVCTFNVIKTLLWHVDISRYTQKQHEASSSSRKSKKKNDKPSCEGQKRPKGSTTLNRDHHPRNLSML